MHSLTTYYKSTIPALYVKSAPRTGDIRSIFTQARYMAPCMLILEDIDTIVTSQTRSYFFNEVDGLENNDGIFMVASTNHLDKLDPGLSSRPSRFDRKYLFPLPNEEERILYCEYWREKLKNKPSIKFPKQLSPAIAGITQDFSFAYLKEAFVATLLVIAGNRAEDRFGGGDDDLDDYELWREMKNQVKLLRAEMDNSSSLSAIGLVSDAVDPPSQPSQGKPYHDALDPTLSFSSPQNIPHAPLPRDACALPIRSFHHALKPRDHQTNNSPAVDLRWKGASLFLDSGSVLKE